MMKVKLEFAGSEHIFANFADPKKFQIAAIRAAQPVMVRHAMAMVKQVRRTIETQGSSAGVKWPPLRPMTVRLKGHGVILQDTRTLMWGLSAWRTGSGASTVWRVGFSPGKIHTPSGLTLAALANLQEHGVRRGGAKRTGKGRKKQGARSGTSWWSQASGRRRVGRWRIPPRPFLQPTINTKLMSTFAAYIPLFFKELAQEMTKQHNVRWITRIVG